MNRISVVLGAMLSITAIATPTQTPPQLNAGEIAAGIKRLGVVGSVLYVAAHPDDENTRLLAWLVGERGVRAGYLSLTRGDGGQNLIGSEQEVMLGLLRTHELLAARRIDGAEQLFTRARDFGYSKSADETLAVWGHEQVLGDVVFAIRKFRPKVIITRFNTLPPNHGHHTASAILAAEAFSAAADPTRFPDQLKTVSVWKTDRLLHNVSTWNLPPNADMSAYLSVDTGGFDPLRGKSWGEIAAQSRSQHKSQGFGVAAERGQLLEYFTSLAGTKPTKDLLEGLDLGWRKWPALVKAIDTAVASFDPRAPHKSVPALVAVHAQLTALPKDHPYREHKLRETEELLVACTGLFLEARAPEPSAAPGDELTIEVLALNRSPAAVQLGSTPLRNKQLKLPQPLKLDTDAAPSTPYWLRARPTPGLFVLEGKDAALLTEPDAGAPVTVSFEVTIGGKTVTVRRPLVYTWTDPVRGELSRPFEIAPTVTVKPDRDLLMFPNGWAQTLAIDLASGRAQARGEISLELPTGWTSVPVSHPFQLSSRMDEKTVTFKITPPKGSTERARLKVRVDNADTFRARQIRYDHVPPLTVREPAEVVLVPVTLTSKGRRIGYIPGAGDRVAESLTAVGYEVTVISEERLPTESLNRFDAIVVGVRAFNANERLAIHREQLLRYVEQGGRLIVQYNTNSRVGPLKVPFGPYPLEIGRDRVTDETATMTALAPDDPLLLKPNRLTPADFEGWVQERGLYFASTWDPKYRPVFSINDPGEPPREGALLVARHGRGAFVYTGLAFFRQLPAGVPGAYRLFANLLAL